MLSFALNQYSSTFKDSGASTPSSTADRISTDELALREGIVVGVEDSIHSSTGRGFIGGVMNSILNFKRKSVTSDPLPANPSEEIDDGYSSVGIEEESLLVQKVRAKCVIQLLLLSAIESLQKNHWQRFEPSQKILVMDTLFSLVEFAASYNSDIKLRQRMQEIMGDRPPPSLLKQEAEGTQLYLAILTLSTMENEADAAAALENVSNESNRIWNLGRKSLSLVGESEKLKQEAERRLVAFYSHILRETIILQSTRPGKSLPLDVYKSLSLRAPITVKVLKAMSSMEKRVFKKHLPEFYPYLTRLICSDQ